MRRLPFGWCVPLIVAVSVSGAARADVPTTDARTVWPPAPYSPGLAQRLKPTLDEADQAFLNRHVPGVLEKSINQLRPLVAEAPFDAGWRLARALWWQAEGTADKERKRALSVEGRQAGEKALAADPGSLASRYFTALCIGEYSHSVGILTALREGLESKFRDPIIEVSKASPKYDHAGAFNALGRYKFELPWPKRDYDESVKYLRRGLELAPHGIRARVYLAETLLARDSGGDAQEAAALLKWVIDESPDVYDRAEALRAKEMARALMSKR